MGDQQSPQTLLLMLRLRPALRPCPAASAARGAAIWSGGGLEVVGLQLFGPVFLGLRSLRILTREVPKRSPDFGVERVRREVVKVRYLGLATPVHSRNVLTGWVPPDQCVHTSSAATSAAVRGKCAEPAGSAIPACVSAARASRCRRAGLHFGGGAFTPTATHSAMIDNAAGDG